MNKDEKDVFDKDWKEYLDLEKLIQENVFKAKDGESDDYKNMLYDLCTIAKGMNYSLQYKASMVCSGNVLATFESTCKEKRNELDEIAGLIVASKRK